MNALPRTYSAMLVVLLLFLTACNQTDTKDSSTHVAREEEKNSMVFQLDDKGMNLKKELMAIKEDDVAFEDIETIDSLINTMLTYLGTPDSQLRDALIYTQFSQWMHSMNDDQKLHIFNVLLSDDALMYKVGERNTDSVFRRSFSLLNLNTLLKVNRVTPFLSDDDMAYAYDRIVDYIPKEKDHRGKDEEKGYAHATAHAADVIETLSHHKAYDGEMLLTFLNLISDLALIDDYRYEHGEAQRLTDAVKVIVMQETLDATTFSAWIDRILASETMRDDASIFEHNKDSFLRALSKGLSFTRRGKVHVSPIEAYLRKDA